MTGLYNNTWGGGEEESFIIYLKKASVMGSFVAIAEVLAAAS